jgi:large subunit ribosomal protein L18
VLKKRERKSPALRRRVRVRKKIEGTMSRPRLSVFRSNRHIYAQVIDDLAGGTLVSASTLSPELRGTLKSAGSMDAAARVGALLAVKALAVQVKMVVFDRNRYRYHGRVKTLAEAARKGGLQF